MALPLQADLKPAPYWYRRLVVIAALVIAIFLLGLFQGTTKPENKLLGNNKQIFLKTLCDHINQAKQRIWCMHYVTRLGDQKEHPVNHVCDLLIQAKQRGVDVRIVLDNSDPNATYPGPDNSAVVQLFRQNNIPVFLDEIEKTTHAKIVLADNQVFIGSHNWTNWALTKNREISVLSNDPQIINQIELLFEEIFSLE